MLNDEYFRTPLDCDVNSSTEDLVSYTPPAADGDYEIDFMQVSLAAEYYQAMAYGAEQAAADVTAASGGTVTVRHTAGVGYTGPADQLADAENILQRGPTPSPRPRRHGRLGRHRGRRGCGRRARRERPRRRFPTAGST